MSDRPVLTGIGHGLEQAQGGACPLFVAGRSEIGELGDAQGSGAFAEGFIAALVKLWTWVERDERGAERPVRSIRVASRS